jgi:PPK2 family polyphosphate:nucleotide phosphotransferase
MPILIVIKHLTEKIMYTEKFVVKPNSNIDLSKVKTSYSGEFKSKSEANNILKKNIKKMAALQDKLYAQDKFALLIIFQAMDAAGKDGMIKHVMSGLNPQGTQVFSFKQPSTEELDHTYLWRINKALPEKGRIGIFNRSHYEDVLVVRVHNLIDNQKLPGRFKNNNIWKMRYEQINNFEKYLYENGIIILKFFLHISKEEQKKRFLKRIEDPAKNWKFSSSDLKEREFWNDYQKYYADAISATSKKYAPWFTIPADKKWFSRLAVSDIIISAMEKINPQYPTLSGQQLEDLKKAKALLQKQQ